MREQGSKVEELKYSIKGKMPPPPRHVKTLALLFAKHVRLLTDLHSHHKAGRLGRDYARKFAQLALSNCGVIARHFLSLTTEGARNMPAWGKDLHVFRCHVRSVRRGNSRVHDAGRVGPERSARGSGRGRARLGGRQHGDARDGSGEHRVDVMAIGDK